MDIGKEIKDQRSFFAQRREFNFFIEDEEITVKTDDLPPETSLNYYIRQKLHLTGTKYMCNEGGCGACVVAVTVTDPTTNCDTILAVNSCLVPIYVCEGWRVHTIESIV
ncbi:aldehyde oxidase 4-like isoform X2 [Photinus pyralis]|uniref:aldehyde oxidase 4-like isoform X2 n=1 Tax=Photinus pyralis TaxID=7054 RepID=UPI0012675D26|nr:aldehyde oxidase 4-like isoform X2 [Photinus pyralis]